MSLESPGSHWKRSSPAPSLAVSVPRLPSTWSLPPAAEQRVGAVAAAQVVVALAAVERQRGERADAVQGGEPVGAAEALHGERLDRDVVDHAGAGAERRHRVAVARDADLVVAVTAARDPAVGAVAAVDVDLARPGHGRGRVGDRVGLAERGHLRVILRLGGGHRHVGRGAVEQQLAVGAADGEAIGGVGAAERDRVGLGVAVAVEPAQVDVGRPQPGAREVADVDVVGTTEGADVRLLDAAEVERDGGDVAGELDAIAVGGDVDLLADVGPVELDGVGAGLAFDDVVAVARVPVEPVVAGAQLDAVDAEVAVGDVVADAADQRLGEGTAAEVVVAAAAVERDRQREGAGVLHEQPVITAAAADLDLVEGGAMGGELGDAVVADVDDDVVLLGVDDDLVAGVVAGDLERAVVDLHAGRGARGSGEREGRDEGRRERRRRGMGSVMRRRYGAGTSTEIAETLTLPARWPIWPPARPAGGSRASRTRARDGPRRCGRSRTAPARSPCWRGRRRRGGPPAPPTR